MFGNFETDKKDINYLPAVGIVILAAGASTRMGTPKQLLLHGERSFLSYTVEVAIASICRPIVVVLGAYADRLQREVSHFPVQVIENFRWSEGMSASIRCGIEALEASPKTTDAAVLMVCDQPFVSAEVIDRLVETYYITGKSIVASEYAETLGVPALFSRDFYSELANLKNKQGAKQIISKYYLSVDRIPFPNGVFDIDTPEDYAQFQAPIEF